MLEILELVVPNRAILLIAGFPVRDGCGGGGGDSVNGPSSAISDGVMTRRTGDGVDGEKSLK